MRTERGVKNISTVILKYVINTVLKFVVRTVFIYYLGEEYVGVSGLFSSILSVLSLAELGFGTAVVYSMYKPAAEGDNDKLSALLSLYKKIYLVVSVIVLIIGLAIIPFLNVFIKDAAQFDINLTIIYIAFILNAVVSYLLSYNRSLLYVNQKNSVENIISMIVQTAFSVAQILVLLFTRNFYIYTFLLPVFTLIENVVITIRVKQLYPDIKAKGKLQPEEKKIIRKNVFALLFHKIGSIAVFSTDNIIISSFIGSLILGRYSNYILIITTVSTLISMIITVVGSSIGNSIAEKSVEDNYKLFLKLTQLFYGVCVLCTACLLALLQPFAHVWLGADRMLPTLTIILAVASFLLTQFRQIILCFKEKAGLFMQDIYKPIAETLVNIGLSIGLVFIWGLDGVIIGTIVSTVFIAAPIETHVLYKHYFKIPVKKFFLKYCYYLFIAVLASAASLFSVYFIPEGIGWLFLKLAIVLAVATFLYSLLIIPMPEYKGTKAFLIQILKVAFNRKKKEKD